MGLVFVHGIGNRSPSRSYPEAVTLRDALFRRFLLARAVPELTGTEIRNPMWGDHAARLRWQHSSLPRKGRERLGTVDTALTDLAEVLGAPPGRALAGLDAADAVDLLYTIADLRGHSVEEIEDLADLGVVLADRHGGGSVPVTASTDRAGPARAGSDRDDADVLQDLERLAASPAGSDGGLERLGGGRRIGRLGHNVLAAGLARFRQQQLGTPAVLAAAALRRIAAEPISLLIGDVFAYLATRGTRNDPGEIVRLVAGDLDLARADGPLVVVAHSMGGNIVYDILSYFRPDIEVDVLVTVGSQVGLFEELSLFAASDATLPSVTIPRVPASSNVRRWVNIVDPADILAYRVDPIFAGPVDYEYPSREPWAHSAYFRQPVFHRRLAARVREVLG